MRTASRHACPAPGAHLFRRVSGVSAAAFACGALLLSGCERTEAGESAALLQAQDAVLAASNASPSEGQTSLEARLAALDNVAGDLAPLASSDNPQRRTLALGLLAEIAAARSQALELQGRSAAAALRGDLSRLLVQVDSVERDAARAEAETVDPGPAVDRVAAAGAEEATRLEASRSAADRLASEVEAARAEREQARGQRIAAAGRESQLEDDAFLVAGDARYAKLNNAARARSDADAAASTERSAEIRLAQLEREREIAEARAALAAQGVERMDVAGQGFAAAGSASAAAATEAKRAAQSGATAVGGAARELHDAFRLRVLSPMDEAITAAADAAGQLEKASADPLDIAGSRLDVADARATAAVASEAFAASLSIVADRIGAVDPASGQTISGLAGELRSEGAARRTAAAEALAEARSSLEQAPAEDPAAVTLTGVAGRIDTLLAEG